MSWLSSLARRNARRHAAAPRRHPGLLDGRAIEPGSELLFLNFNATMGVQPDGRILRSPQLGALLAQNPDLQVVLVTDAQRSGSDYRHLFTLLPQPTAARIKGVATTAASTPNRFEQACRRYASDFGASAYVAVDALERGYGHRCSFLVLTSSSGLDDAAVERCTRMLREQRRAEEQEDPSLGMQVRARLSQSSPFRHALTMAGLVRS